MNLKEEVSRVYRPKRPTSFLDEALKALEASQPEEGRTPGPDKIIYAIHALVWAALSVAEETSRS